MAEEVRVPEERRTVPGVEDLSPYLSLRLLAIDGADHEWTSDLIALTQAIEDLLPSAFNTQRPKSRTNRNGGKSELPDETTEPSLAKIEGRFLPFGSDVSADYLDPTASDLLARANRERTGWLAGCTLAIKAKPPWLRRTSEFVLENVTHQLLVVAVLPPFVAVSSTRERFGTELVALLDIESMLAERLPRRIAPVSDEVLDRTFVRGEAFNLWLNGMHRQTVFKADRQTMTGLDLRQAVDPIGHRTFSYSSVRSRLQAVLPGGKQAAVGYAKSSRVLWVGPTMDAHDYMRQLAVLCDLTAETMAETRRAAEERRESENAARAGLRYLSEAIDPTRLAEAKRPFEVTWDLVEPSQTGVPAETDRAVAIEQWRAHGRMEVAEPLDQTLPTGATNDLIVPVRALWDGQVFRTFDVVVHHLNEKLQVAIERIQDRAAPGGKSFADAFVVFDSVDADLGPAALTVRFDSGHVLNQERLYLADPPPVPFEDWRWISFEGDRVYDIIKEKPTGWTVRRSAKNHRSVKAQTSDDLFSFIVHRVSRLDDLANGHEWFMLCHDQPQEVADFVLVVPAEQMISHIHVKGANSAQASRRIAIGAYDLVVTQAIKNLPRLDVLPLLNALKQESVPDRDKGQFLVTGNHRGGVDVTMDSRPFMNVLRDMEKRPLRKKRVIIFQPHVRADLWLTKVKEWYGAADPSAVEGIQPVFMLSSLLLDAKIACMRIGATFSVWGTCDVAIGTIPSAQRSPFRHDRAHVSRRARV